MSDPVLLARGRTADVFALGPERVLRRYRDGGDVLAEAAMMADVTGAADIDGGRYHTETSLSHVPSVGFV